jgi:hypothetical protein
MAKIYLRTVGDLNCTISESGMNCEFFCVHNKKTSSLCPQEILFFLLLDSHAKKKRKNKSLKPEIVSLQQDKKK